MKTPRILLALLAFAPFLGCRRDEPAAGAAPPAQSPGVAAAQPDTVQTAPVGTFTPISISAGGEHTCSLTTGGAAYCWGYNRQGQLGQGTEHPVLESALEDSLNRLPEEVRRASIEDALDGLRTLYVTLPVLVSGGLAFQAISAGGGRTCGLTTGGAAYCWGDNNHSPVAVAADFVFQAISAGDTHTCGLTSAGVAYCWGFNDYGQVGDGTTTTSRRTAVSGGLVFQAISAGYQHTCGLTRGGAAYCWGDNRNGQVGDGTDSIRFSSPVAVSRGLVFQAISAGDTHTCAVTTGGAAYCWGKNEYGQLGDGTTSNRTSPVAVSGGLVFQSISAGGNHTCGLSTGGAAHCWGQNHDFAGRRGQLGDSTTESRTSPVAVSGGVVFRAISAGTTHSCGLTPGGAAYCWGNNEYGQLGDGDFADRLTPVAVRSP